MITNKIISVLITITAIIVFPIQFITTFILGILVSLTFGMLLMPISIIWIVLFLGPLLGFSYIWEKIPLARFAMSLVGIPLALLANIYVAITPSMGEMAGRFEKMILCQTFPLTWRYLQFKNNKLNIGKNDDLTKILQEVSRGKILSKYLDELRVDVYSRPDYVIGKYELSW